MGVYKHKPTLIEAVRIKLSCAYTENEFRDLLRFLEKNRLRMEVVNETSPIHYAFRSLDSGEVLFHFPFNTYLLKGIDGEFYNVSVDTFEKSYELETKEIKIDYTDHFDEELLNELKITLNF